MKYFAIILIGVALLLPTVSRAAEPVEVYYFSDPQCSLCGDMQNALAQMKESNPEMRVVTFDISTSDEAKLILQDLFSIYQPAEQELPAVFVGAQTFTGYDADVVSGVAQTIEACGQGGCPSPSATLRQYYADILAKEQRQERFPMLLFWAIFMILWPIMGGIAIVIVLKKYRAHLAKPGPIPARR